MANFLIAIFAGVTVFALVFLVLAAVFINGFLSRAIRTMSRPVLFLGIIAWALLMTAAVTQTDLAHQVTGLLPTANGGTGQNSSATFPSSGTVMITTTGVTASQLPTPTASTIGGVESITSSSHNWVSYIDTSGVPHQSQPAYSDISGTPPGTTINQAVPTGTINGSNTSFTLGFTPNASSNVVCYLNGLMQQQGSGNDYTISGTAITYLTAPPTGSKLLCTGY